MIDDVHSSHILTLTGKGKGPVLDAASFKNAKTLKSRGSDIWADIHSGANEGEEQKGARLNSVNNTQANLVTAAPLAGASARSECCQSSGVKRLMIYNYTFGSADPSLKSHPQHCPN